MLIPVLTTFPLPLGFSGDILGGGFILALAGFSVALSGAESGAPYAQLGSSRAMTFGALIEPTILFVIFAVALITHTDLPYALSATIRSSTSQMVRPSHVLAAVAFFLVVLVDTGRIPVETHSGTLEFGMIDEARTLEHSGPPLALLKWGSTMKQLILYTILINVFLAPWGLASTGKWSSVVLAVAALLGKAMVLGMVFAVIDNSSPSFDFSRSQSSSRAHFFLAVLSVLVFYVGGG